MDNFGVFTSLSQSKICSPTLHLVLCESVYYTSVECCLPVFLLWTHFIKGDRDPQQICTVHTCHHFECFFYHVSCFTDVKRFFSPDRRLSETCCSSASVVSRLQEMQNCICLQAHRAQSGWRFKSAAAASERGRQRAAASGPDMREGLSAGSQWGSAQDVL